MILLGTRKVGQFREYELPHYQGFCVGFYLLTDEPHVVDGGFLRTSTTAFNSLLKGAEIAEDLHPDIFRNDLVDLSVAKII